MRTCLRKAIPLLACCIFSAANAAPYALSSDGNAVVRIISQSAAAPLNTALITAAYPGWSVSNGGVSGSFSTTGYSAGWNGAFGGAQFQGTYTQTAPVKAGSQLNYIQIIHTNVPLGGVTSPYIDPQPNDDTLPFYLTRPEAASFGTAKSVSFSDFSKRAAASLSATNPITWSASLYPVIDQGGNTVQVGNGVQWGWDMKPATVGKASATFNGPSPTCPPATCSGIGTDTINWGLGSPGGLSFSGVEFAPKVGEAFKIGTISYTNGATDAGTALGGIGLDIALNFDNVGELNFVYHAGMTINNTTNTSDPIASADYVRFAAGGFSDAFNVLEGASASADLMAKLTPVLQLIPGLVGDKDMFSIPDELLFIGYDLQLIALANPSAGGFITVAAIPLPGSLPLLLVGLLAGALSWRRNVWKPA